MNESFDQKVAEHKPFFADLLYYYISERYPAYKQKVSERVGEVKAKDISIKEVITLRVILP